MLYSHILAIVNSFESKQHTSIHMLRMTCTNADIKHKDTYSNTIIKIIRYHPKRQKREEEGT